MQFIPSRRGFLAGMSCLSLAALTSNSTLAEPPPETTSVRFPVFKGVSDCHTPTYIATELLRAEGFTDIRFLNEGEGGTDSADWLAHGGLDFDYNFPVAHIRSIDRGVPIKVLAGMHVGCLELIANESIRTIVDLKGKRIGIDALNSIPHLLLKLIAAYVGLDPDSDLKWITGAAPLELLADAKIDAFLALPPQPQQARDRKIGHVILNTTVDQPWSHNYCCMLAVTDDYLSRYPNATKRVIKSILKTIDLCVSNPKEAARRVAATSYASSYDYALQTINEVRYDAWRDYDPEDALRFYALRMRETGMITVELSRIIADGTDWRYLDELKRELKM